MKMSVEGVCRTFTTQNPLIHLCAMHYCNTIVMGLGLGDSGTGVAIPGRDHIYSLLHSVHISAMGPTQPIQ
jgi:hypothetical protein